MNRSITVWGMVAAGVLAATLACCAMPVERQQKPLLPVNAPLAPVAPGTRFVADTPLPSKERESLLGEALPPRSTGTHITASLMRKDGTRLVAVWGDSILWEKRGDTWQPAATLPRLTEKMVEVVTLSEEKETGAVVVGTRREGRFKVEGKGWKAVPRPNAPYDANAQGLGAYRGVLYVATLNDGLVLRDEKGRWGRVALPVISTNASRQLVVWKDSLYVRHGSGVVDKFDGRVWTRDVFTKVLPRRQVSTLVVDGEALLLAQWGGWSETRDGVTFANRFPNELKGLPITALLPVKDTVYVGTQGRGLAVCDRVSGEVRSWQDERKGIADDWVTALAVSKSGRVVVGTFVGGAFWRIEGEEEYWKPLAGTEQDCVTGAVTVSGRVFVALRRGGVRCFGEGGANPGVSLLPETQCVWADEASGLVWVGTRTGLVTAGLEEKNKRTNVQDKP